MIKRKSESPGSTKIINKTKQNDVKWEKNSKYDIQLHERPSVYIRDITKE